ncbi:MAG: CopG family transcriptional regulator [Candidatus Korarchaeota archaeon]|nr:CopG family transcriptional regulator [Candidatus Korarchaeota archaeon]
MSEVVSFKVPKEVKEKMRKYSKTVKWSEELRNYVIERIKAIEREENLRKVTEIIKSTGEVPEGFSLRSIREDRES